MAPSSAIFAASKATRTWRTIYASYLRELYQWAGMSETVNLEHTKIGYYTNTALNPTLVVPLGPELDLERAYDRDNLSGKGIYKRTGAAG